MKRRKTSSAGAVGDGRREAAEATKREAATAAILKAIRRSPGDAQPAFDAIVRSALRLVNGHSALVLRLAGGMLHLAAHTSTGRSGDEAIRRFYPRPVGEVTLHGRAIRSRRPCCVADTERVPASMAAMKEMARKRGYRSLMAVPMLRDGVPIGSIGVSRKQSGAFSKHQIRALETFADQAVIAIENARLFNETREALERQTATSEVLRVIAASPSDTQPVFDAIARSAQKLFGARAALVCRRADDMLHLAAHTATTQAGDAALRNLYPAKLTGQGAVGKAVLSGEPASIIDVETDPAYSDEFREGARERGYRSLLAAPMLRDGAAIGAIAVTRPDPGPFSDHQVNLLKTFADQAVIAIENVRLFNETREALEQQKASADVLSVISSSPTDITPVYRTILENVTQLCEANIAALFLYDGEFIRAAAHRNATPEFAQQLDTLRVPPSRETPTRRAVLEKRIVHVEDVLSDPGFSLSEAHRREQPRTVLSVPLLREETLIGVITVWRREPRLFTDTQVALVKTFADQAVIAIENVRLFNETKEALERQTATAEILKVIAGSPTEVQPVFDVIVERAVRLCGARFGRVYRYDGSAIHMMASHGLSANGLGQVQRMFPRPAADDTTVGRVILARQPYFVEDVERDQAVPSSSRQMMEALGTRRQLTIPMLRAGEPIGAITLGWDKPAGFDQQEASLLKTFADQAVIAIENTRLFQELQTTNDDLREALEQQTATGDILKVISRSTSDVKPVFETIIGSAVRLCEGAFGTVFTFDGQMLDIGAEYNYSESVTEMFRREYPQPADRSTPSGRAIVEGRVNNIPDIAASDYSQAVRDRAQANGWRGLLTVPMTRAGVAIGAIAVARRQAGAFDDSYVALLQTFADQAVIAIENVRLFNETKEALEQQTATAEVLKVISGSPTDVAPVFEAILKSAVTLCGAELAAVFSYDGKLVHMGATHNWPQEALQYFSKIYPSPPSPKLLSGRTILGKSLVEITDAATDEDYDPKSVVTGHWRRMLGAPMLLEGQPLGALVVAWRDPGETPPRQVELLQTFADQAAIAIENARLFRETQEKSAQLEVANQHKSEFLANMSHELRTPLNAVIGFSEALMERMFGEVNEKQADYLKDIHESGRHLLSLINDILDLSKIEAGRMELDVSTFHLPSALTNAMTLIRERAQRHGIQLALEVDERLAEFSGDERKFKQIMLNLLSNAVKFTPDGGKVDVSARKCNGQLEVAVRDTGIGIAPEDQALVFEEFRQAGRDRMRKAEGTGLGLALTKRFVELHGGAIRLDSTPGQGSTFSFTLPVR